MNDYLLIGEPDELGVLTVWLNRPERLNAIVEESWDEILDLCGMVRRSRNDVRALVLTGKGSGFCAGLDLSEVSGLAGRDLSSMWTLQTRGADAVHELHSLPIPIVAAVNGPAIGAGLALCLAADIRVASPAARFGVGFINVGVSSCDVGVSWFLPRIVGMGRAAELMLLGEVISAATASTIGLVNRVDDDVVGTATSLARSAATKSPFAIALTKEGLDLAIDAPSLRAAMAIENRNQVIAVQSPEMQQTLERFLERRDHGSAGHS